MNRKRKNVDETETVTKITSESEKDSIQIWALEKVKNHCSEALARVGQAAVKVVAMATETETKMSLQGNRIEESEIIILKTKLTLVKPSLR